MCCATEKELLWRSHSDANTCPPPILEWMSRGEALCAGQSGIVPRLRIFHGLRNIDPKPSDTTNENAKLMCVTTRSFTFIACCEHLRHPWLSNVDKRIRYCNSLPCYACCRRVAIVFVLQDVGINNKVFWGWRKMSKFKVQNYDECITCRLEIQKILFWSLHWRN